MRSYSLFTILLLCLAILVVDVLAFYWLQSITQLLTSSTLKTVITILFWFFTIGLIAAIIILKITIDDIDPKRKQLLISSLYGLTVSSFIPKFILLVSFRYSFLLILFFLKVSRYLLYPLLACFRDFCHFL